VHELTAARGGSKRAQRELRRRMRDALTTLDVSRYDTTVHRFVSSVPAHHHDYHSSMLRSTTLIAEWPHAPH